MQKPSLSLRGLLSRRQWILSVAATATAAAGKVSASSPSLVFPRDMGSHNQFDIEWWYLTGYLNVPNSATPIGVQITFFRKRIDSTHTLSQRLAAKHLVFAHAAIAVPPGVSGHTNSLHHSQRTARWNEVLQQAPTPTHSAYPMAWASSERLDVGIVNADGVWHLSSTHATSSSSSTPRFTAGVHSAGPKAFKLALQAEATQPPVLQGNNGLSQKGPEPQDTSWYTTHPQLQLSAALTLAGNTQQLSGRGWLDHEWSHGFMPKGAVGWDWVGFNFDDGSALTAFQLRGSANAALWRGGSWRASGTVAHSFEPADIVFEPGSTWQSPRTGIAYPVIWRLRTPQGVFEVRPVMTDQELDSRQSTGTIYWEGLCGLYQLQNGQATRVAWGYLEMTGYGQAIRI